MQLLLYCFYNHIFYTGKGAQDEINANCTGLTKSRPHNCTMNAQCRPLWPTTARIWIITTAHIPATPYTIYHKPSWHDRTVHSWLHQSCVNMCLSLHVEYRDKAYLQPALCKWQLWEFRFSFEFGKQLLQDILSTVHTFPFSIVKFHFILIYFCWWCIYRQLTAYSTIALSEVGS